MSYSNYRKMQQLLAESKSFNPYEDIKERLSKRDVDDIAPIKDKTYTEIKEQQRAISDMAVPEANEERTWFSSGLFDDGYQFGDITGTILGTTADLTTNLLGGALEIGEGVVDAGAYLVGGAADLFGLDELAEDTKKFIADDLYSGEEVATRILTGGLAGEGAFDDVSVLGEKADSLAQSGGQLAATIGLQMVGVPWWVTSGVTSFGSEVEHAFNEGASYGEAGLSGVISAGAEILTEKLFGGSGLGEKGLINVGALTKGISSKVVKALADFGLDMAGEGTEEVLSSVFSRLGTSLYKEENLEEILFSEEAVDEYVESFIGGGVLGGVMNASNAVRSVKNKTDYRTGLSATDQKVFDKVYNDAIAEAEKGGKRLTKKEKEKIYSDTLEKVEKGYISTDTIEEVLGGESYTAYKSALDEETARQKKLDAYKAEYDTLYKMKNGDKSDAQIDRQAFLRQQIDELTQYNTSRGLKTRLHDEVYNLAKGGKLVESYNEIARRGEAFKVDLSQYTGKQKEAYKRAMESGVLNNTNRSHELVDILSKIEADKGIVFDYANNAKLKESGFAIDGKTINGFEKGGKVTLNVESSKAWQSTVGHEVTHILEGTEAYEALQSALFKYAESKGELASRKAALTETYKDIKDADIDKELTADLVGDYLFTDKNFIRELTTDKNLFQKVYDEIKYLCKVATGKELTEIEKVRKEFDKAWKELGQVEQSEETSDSNVKYSVSKENSKAVNSDNNYAPTFYSKMGEVVDGIKQDKIGAASAVSYLTGKGVKAEEIKWSGIEQFLEGKKSVTKAELQEFVKNSTLQIEEETKTAEKTRLIRTGKNEKTLYIGGRAVQKFKVVGEFEDLVLENDPKGIVYSENEILNDYVPNNYNTARWKNNTLEGGKNYREIVFKLPNSTYSNPAMKTHFGENAKGILAHARIQDFVVKGKKMLFIEEIQSDWHNEAHRKGHKYLDKGVKTDADIRNDTAEAYRAFAQSDVIQSIEGRLTRSEYNGNAVNLLSDVFDGNKAAYSDLAYFVNLTSEEKAFINKAVSEEAKRQKTLETAERYNETLVPDAPFRENYHEFVLKRLLRMAAENGYDSIGWTPAEVQTNRWSDEFSEGYRIEYDQDMPKFLNKYGKQWGAKVETAKLKNGTEVWSMDITDSMKDSVLHKGQVLYSLSEDSNGNELSLAVQKRFANSKAVDENGNLKVLYHGTANGEFYTFDKSKGSVEGDFGSGFYFTDSESDVENNYEGGGADFDNKVARRAEQIESEEGIEYHEAEARAREELYKGSNKHTVYLNIENPAIVGETNLLDYDSFAEEYDRNDYDSDEDYESGVEYLIQDKIDEIIWDIDRNIDIYSTDGIAEVLWNAVNEGGIDIEQLKANINNLYLEDNNGNLVGNEVTRQIIESLGYDGIIDPTVSSKFNMGLSEDTTHYIVFKPNQIKSIDNQNPTDDPDIRYSLSENSLDNSKNLVYNGERGEGYVATDEFRNLQAESQRVSDEDTKLYHSGSKQIDDEVRRRLSRAFGLEIRAANSERIHSIRTLLNPKTNNNVNIVEGVDASLFHDCFEISRKYLRNGELVDLHDIETTEDHGIGYKYCDNYLSEDGLSGFSITPDGDLISVFNLNAEKGFLKTIAPIVKEKAKTLDCYASPNQNLMAMYEKIFGFKTASLMDYNMKYDHDDIAKNHNKPPVAFMVNTESDIETRQFTKDEYDEAVAYRNGFVMSENIAPVQNSLSNAGDQFAPVGNYSTPANETYLAPTKEDVSTMGTPTEATPTVEAVDEAPIIEDMYDDVPMPTDADAPPMPDEIAPMTEDEANALQDEKAKADAKLEGEPKTRKQLYNNIINDVKATFTSSGFDFDDVLGHAKDLSTFSTVDNTPQRVMEKALGYKEGQILADLTVNKVAQNETEGIKWLNSFTNRKGGVLAKLSEKYSIKEGSKESAAAQMYAEGFYVAENGDIVAYGDAELAKDFPDANVQANIKGLASDPIIRQIYDQTLDAINESRTRNAYPEIQKLDNYFLHFRAMDDTFSKLGLPFNPNDIRAKDLPTDLNGVTADLKPGQPYFASAMHRKGKRTSFDLLGGLERYLTSAKNQIYHIDDIQTLRALRNYIADTYGQANGLEGLDALSEEEAQERIEQVYGSHLSTFAKFLNEEANVIAGKTALIDRGLEGVIGRRGMTFMDSVRKQVGSNMIGFNVSSSLTNFLAGVQAVAKTSKLACVKSLAQTASSRIGSIFGKTDSFVENNPTIIRRKGAERFYRTPFQKVADSGYVLMSAVDEVTTEFIVRAKYNEFIQKGMSEAEAIAEADKWTSRLMGDRSLGQMPQIFNSKTLGLVTQFQLEVRNQLDSQFYDTIQEAKASNEDIKNNLERNAKTAAKVTKTFFELAVLQHLFGKGFEAVAGYNPAFDIIGVLATALGLDDDEESEDTALDNVEQGFLELLEDLPYASTLVGGGRIPVSAALPVKELVTGKDEYGNDVSRWDTIKETAPYYVMPTGYGQLKKTTQGLSMFNTDEEHPIAGSYTDSGDLRFPVDDTLGNRIQAGIFGQYANKNAREYFDNDYAPLKEKQIQEYMDADLPIADYWKYRDGLKGLKTNAEKANYINSLDIENWQKNLLMNNILDRKEDVDMSNYGDYGSFEEFDYAEKNPEKYKFFKDNGISYKDYKSADEDGKRAYNWAYENPEGYTLSKVVTNDVVKYRSYVSDMYDIKADKDAYGKSISGSRKEKVINYINNLDVDYETKIILFKTEYPSDDTYNADIINYINNRNDLTYEERVTIYTELGFRVKDGYVYAD